MKSEFSTAAVSERQRPEYWNELVCQHCVPANSQLKNPGSFNGRFSAQSVGNLEISSMSASPHIWERTSTHMRRDPNESFLLSLMKSGAGQLSQSGRSTQISNGDIVLYDAERPFTYALEPESVLLLRIPRRQLLYRAPHVERYTAVRFVRDKPITSLLSNMVQEAASLDFSQDILQTVQAQFAGSLLDLLGAAIQVQMAGDSASASHRNKLLENAKNFIESSLDDPSLTVDRIAMGVNVSERTLTRIFTESGITPMRWVWHRRLEAAYQALSDGRVRRVTDAAFRYGFNDVSHFSRIFKLVYGYSPKRLLTPHSKKLET